MRCKNDNNHKMDTLSLVKFCQGGSTLCFTRPTRDRRPSPFEVGRQPYKTGKKIVCEAYIVVHPINWAHHEKE